MSQLLPLDPVLNSQGTMPILLRRLLRKGLFSRLAIVTHDLRMVKTHYMRQPLNNTDLRPHFETQTLNPDLTYAWPNPTYIQTPEYKPKTLNR